MKRLPLVLLLLAAFALGAGVATKLNTYSYVPDELNAPCGKSVLEWNLMAGHIEPSPVKATNFYNAVRLESEPKPEGLVVRAYFETVPNATGKAPLSGGTVERFVRKRLKLGAMKRRLYILFFLDDKLAWVQGNESYYPLGPNATKEEQLKALTSVMAKADKPKD